VPIGTPGPVRPPLPHDDAGDPEPPPRAGYRRCRSVLSLTRRFRTVRAPVRRSRHPAPTNAASRPLPPTVPGTVTQAGRGMGRLAPRAARARPQLVHSWTPSAGGLPAVAGSRGVPP